MLSGAGDSTRTMGWYQWWAPSSLSACCTITDCCCSSVARCEIFVWGRKEKQWAKEAEGKDSGRGNEQETVLLNRWRVRRKKKGGERGTAFANAVVVVCVYAKYTEPIAACVWAGLQTVLCLLTTEQLLPLQWHLIQKHTQQTPQGAPARSQIGFTLHQ